MIFYGLSLALILLALATVLTKHIFRSAIYLMGVLTLSAGLFLLLGAEFLAGVQILVYVGGVVVLLVFAVMLTQSQDLLLDQPSLLRKLSAAVSAILFFMASGFALVQSNLSEIKTLDETTASINPNAISELGKSFLSTEADGYLVPFELISLLLLAVLIAGIVLSRKEKLK